MTEKRVRVVLILYSLLFAIFNVHIIFLQNPQWRFCGIVPELLVIALVTALVFVVAGAFFRLLKTRSCFDKETAPSGSDLIKYFFIVFGIQLVLWGIIFLAYWPGLFSEDIGTQLRQGHGDPLTTHHPLVHTFYTDFFYYHVGGRLLGNYNIGIAISILIQMIVDSLSLSYSHLLLYKKGVRKPVRVLLIVLAGILPVFSLLFICTTKDAFFAAFMGLSCTLICEYEMDRREFEEHRWKYLLLFLSVVGMILFRKNGIYPLIAMGGVALIRYAIQKDILKHIRFLGTGVAAILTGVVLLYVIKTVSGAFNGSMNEMLSVPYQQISYVYSIHADELSKEETEAIFDFLPMVKEYEPFRADPVKDYANIYGKSREFVKLWVDLGTRYFGDYVTAFLRLNAGYLCVADTTFAEVYGTENGKGIFMTYFSEGFEIEHVSLIPPLEALYEKLYTKNYYKYVPGLNILCSPAFYFWLILLLFAFSFIDKDYSVLPAFFFIFTYIATLLLGPCAVIRYALPYIVCIPAFGLLTQINREKL